MKISEIEITPIKSRNGLIGFASIVIDGDFYLGSIGIHTRLAGGYRLTYPTKIVSGRDINIYHPINKNASQAIEEAIINKFNELMETSNEKSRIENEVETF